MASDRDLAGRTVHFRGVDVLILGGYARDGEYQETAAAVARIIRNGTLPFVRLADFNTEPATLRAESWLDRLRAQVIVPDTAITCHQGGGSMIDYGICLECLVLYIKKFTAVTAVPWGPHDWLRLTLRKSPREVMVRTFARPRNLSQTTRLVGRGDPKKLDWEAAIALARQRAAVKQIHISPEEPAQLEADKQMGVETSSADLGQRLASWACATELQALVGVGVEEFSQAMPHLGRAAKPRISSKPLLGRPCFVPEAQQIPRGYGAGARLWATCRALTAKLRCAVVRNASDSKICFRKAQIVELTTSSSSSLRNAWESIGSNVDRAAGLFAVLAACSYNASAESMQTAMHAIERLEGSEVHWGQEAATTAWHRWVARSIEGGARQAHRWTNQPNAPEECVSAPGLVMPSEIAQHNTEVWAKQW